MEYLVVYLIPLNSITALPEPEEAGEVHTLSNGMVDLELSQEVGWAIKRFMVGGTNRVQPNSDYANRLSLWTARPGMPLLNVVGAIQLGGLESSSVQPL